MRNMELPNNWDQLESEYNKDYDPYADKCPACGSEDLSEGGEHIICISCGELIK